MFVRHCSLIEVVSIDKHVMLMYTPSLAHDYYEDTPRVMRSEKMAFTSS